MAISIIDGPTAISPFDPPTLDLIRLDPTHVLAVGGRFASVVDTAGGSLAIGTSSSFDVGAGEVKGGIVDAALFKVGFAYGIPSRYLRAAILDCNLGTDSFTSGNALLRDAFTENPSYPVLSFEGAACTSGTSLQVFWVEDDSSTLATKVQYYYMVVDCSGATPVAGTATMWLEVDWPTTDGAPCSALMLSSSSGILLSSAGKVATFTFGGAPGAWASIGGISDILNRAGVVLPGSVGISTDGGGNGVWCTGSGATDVSPPAILANARVAQLQTRTVLSVNGQYVERIIINGSTIDSVDNNFEYCAACDLNTESHVVAVQADNSQAVVLRGADIYLLGGVPTTDPFPASAGNSRLWIYKTENDGVDWVSRGIKT